jgi:hypothetical protein
MNVVIASCAVMPPEFGDDPVLASRLAEHGLEAAIVSWDEPGFDWSEPGLVVIRSTWDYSSRRDEFIEWTHLVGDRLHNAPALVEWNSDKRYMADLAGAGLPVVETSFVGPGESWRPPEGQFVVKPTVSAGGRDTGRFGPGSTDVAEGLVARIQHSNRTAMVQPFQASVDTRGETALIYIDGVFSHALRKRAVLRPDEVAPMRDNGIGAAEAMYDPGLVTGAEAGEAELALGADVLAEIGSRFGYTPLFARVDMLGGEAEGPVLMELEAVEPNLYFDLNPDVVGRLAAAIAARA